jgi:hypothetical protein
MAGILHTHEHHDPINLGMVSTPHGPETGDDHASFRNNYDGNAAEEVLKPHLYPDDMYTPEGVYFADLPLSERVKFVTNVDNQEVKKELSSTWSMFKADPLSPVSWYFKNAVLPGAGLGLEGLV